MIIILCALMTVTSFYAMQQDPSEKLFYDAARLAQEDRHFDALTKLKEVCELSKTSTSEYYPRALFGIGSLYDAGTKTIGQNKLKALRYYKKAEALLPLIKPSLKMKLNFALGKLYLAKVSPECNPEQAYNYLMNVHIDAQSEPNKTLLAEVCYYLGEFYRSYRQQPEIMLNFYQKAHDDALIDRPDLSALSLISLFQAWYFGEGGIENNDKSRTVGVLVLWKLGALPADQRTDKLKKIGEDWLNTIHEHQFGPQEGFAKTQLLKEKMDIFNYSQK